MEAIFYEKRDYGLLEVRREHISQGTSMYSFVKLDPMTAAMMTGDLVMSQAIRQTETFTKIGELPTGEIIFLKV